MMSLVRLLSFTTLACGCVTGKYREVATHREVVYVEEKGNACGHHGASPQPHARARAVRRRRARRRSRRQVNGSRCDSSSLESRFTDSAPGNVNRNRYKLLTSSDAPRVEAGAASEAPHPDSDPSRHPAVLSRGLPRSAPFSHAGDCFRNRHFPSLQSRGPLPELRRHPAARPLSGLDRRLDQGGGEGPRPAGSLFLNVGAKPTDPWTALDVAQAARAAPAAPEHDSLDQVDRDRPGCRRRRRRPDARSQRRPLQADQQRPLRQRLPGVHLPLHARRPDAARPPRDRRQVPGPVERRALGRRREQPALPRQHLVHPLRDDPEPRQGPAAPGHLPAAHPGVLRPPARAVSRRRSCSIPSWDSATPPWLLRSSGSTSWESRSISTTWRKRSRALGRRSSAAVNSQLPNSQFPINAQRPTPKTVKTSNSSWALAIGSSLGVLELRVGS